MLLFIAHESQHDLLSFAEVDGAQCEFCLNGTGPVGITSTEQIAFTDVTVFFIRQPLNQAVPHSFHGFSYTSRAPPAV